MSGLLLCFGDFWKIYVNLVTFSKPQGPFETESRLFRKGVNNTGGFLCKTPSEPRGGSLLWSHLKRNKAKKQFVFCWPGISCAPPGATFLTLCLDCKNYEAQSDFNCVINAIISRLEQWSCVKESVRVPPRTLSRHRGSGLSKKLQNNLSCTIASNHLQ